MQCKQDTSATSSARSFNRVGDAPRSLLRRSNKQYQRPPRTAFYTESAALLDVFHSEQGTVFEIVPGINAIAKLSGNRIVYLVPVDAMVWTEELETYIDGEIEWMRENHPGASLEAWLTGTSSARVKEELQARAWSVRDKSISVIVE